MEEVKSFRKLTIGSGNGGPMVSSLKPLRRKEPKILFTVKSVAAKFARFIKVLVSSRQKKGTRFALR